MSYLSYPTVLGCFIFFSLGEALRPLVMIHGLGGEFTSLEVLSDRVNEDFPEMPVFSLDAFNDKASAISLNDQIPTFLELVANVTELYGDITLLGFSQGGLIARAIIEMSGNPNIHTFISLSSPGAGQYGGVAFLENITDNLTADDVWKLCYNPLGQLFSGCNYWKDPEHLTLYKLMSNFLPYLNNEIDHDSADIFKENFIRLKRVQLIGGSDDGVISPWQSALFGFYDTKFNIVPMKDQKYFVEDSFGLKTLFEEGRLTQCVVTGIAHLDWISNEQVYSECIKNFLL